jgi:CHASE3 domain sensor protein
MLPRFIRPRPLLYVAIPLVTGAAWLAVETQRSAADHAIEEVQVAQMMLTAMLDQRANAQAYLDTRKERFQRGYRRSRRNLETSFA